jgi:CubicO group peptidase (beta-lactamase class C family)
MRNRRDIGALAMSALLACAGCASGQPPSPPLPQALATDLDKTIGTAWSRITNAPGIAVAVYTPDGVYARGFGATDIRTGEAVTADTAFYIASTTKAVTAMAMNLLHHRGELNLDQTLRQFSPDAPFPDAVQAERVTLRNLLTHTSGIANEPIVFRSAFTGEHTPDQLWSLLGESQVNAQAPLGSFRYTNVGYNILTILTDRRLGVRWQDLLAREIFAPAGMSHTTAYMSKARQEGWSLARPHSSRTAAGAERVDFEKTDGMMQSAGGLVMSANDAVRWLELLANDGRIGGKQILPADVVRESRELVVKAGPAGGDLTRETYGLGWYVGSYRNEVTVHHGGGFAGYASLISYMPERRYGVAVFVNDSGAGSALPEAISRYAYDRLLGRPEARDADATAARLVEAFKTRIAGMAADEANRAGRKWTLSQPKASYAGAYYSPLMGTLLLSVDGENLSAQLGPLRSEIEPYTLPDSMRVAFGGSGSVIRFEVGQNGKVAAAIFSGARFEKQ